MSAKAAVAVPLLAAALFALVAAAGEIGPSAFRVAFVRDGDAYVLDAATGRETRVTTGAVATKLRWAPDGGALYVRAQTGLKRWRPGGPAEAVREGVWSPDGTAVAFAEKLASGAPGTAVWVEEAGQRRRLTPEEPLIDWSPRAWSPDGQHLALSRIQLGPPPGPGPSSPYPGEGELVLLDRAGGGRIDVPLPSDWNGVKSGWPDDVLWSPTSDRLAVWVGPPNPCASCRAGGAPILVVDAVTGHAQPARSALRDFGGVSWARDGSFVVLSTGTARDTYWNKHLARADLPSSGLSTELARDERYADTQPAVSPDGRLVVFARGRDQEGAPARGSIDPDLHSNVALIASRRLWVVGADGAGAHQLLDAPSWTDDAPRWTPDGRWIVFVRWRPPKPSAPPAVELWATRPDGSDAHRLAPLSLPRNFTDGFGFYGKFDWHDTVAVAPR